MSEDRIVIGEGYPWANGLGTYFEITLRSAPMGGSNLPLNFPKHLWNKTVAKYRLVLEPIEGEESFTYREKNKETIDEQRQRESAPTDN